MGGAQQVVRLLGHSLSRQHDILVVATFGGGVLADRFRADGIPLTILDNGRSWRRPVGWLWAFGRGVWQLWMVMRTFRPDVVNVHMHGNLVEVWLACRLAGVSRLVFTLHNTYPFFQPRTGRERWRKAWMRWMYRRFTHLIAISEEVRDWAVKQGMARPEQVTVVRNGITLTPQPSAAERAAWRAAYGWPTGRLVFIAVGALLPKKGYPVLLEAVAQLPAELRQRALFIVVGEGSARPHLEAQIARLKLSETVQLLGVRHDVAALLAASDGYVAASHYEGLSLALLEAMQAGLPVISTAVAGSTWLVRPGVNGFLTPVNDAAALSERLAYCLTHPTRLAGWGAASRAIVARDFSADRMAAETEAVLGVARVTPESVGVSWDPPHRV